MDQRDVSFRCPDLKLFVRDVRDRQGKKRPITVHYWATVKYVKDLLQQIMHIPSSSLRLYHGPLLTSGSDLPNHRTLHDAGMYRSGETLLLDIKRSQPPYSSLVYSVRHCNDVCISSSMFDSTPKALRSLVQHARRGFAVGYKPELVLDGSGGTYFLHDARKNKIAVFKPADEEPYAENNPRNYIQGVDKSLCLREGIVPGEACIREVAAYLLDHDGLSSVPMTTLAEARHPAFNTNGARLPVAEDVAAMGSHSIDPHPPVKFPTIKKVGSFQEYVSCKCTMDDISPSKLSEEEVHKIAILDIRIMNADRNAANLLVKRREDNSLELVPIDHGFCLRSVCDVSWMDWCWLDWPQMKKVGPCVSAVVVCSCGMCHLTRLLRCSLQPLTKAHKEYIESLDIEADARLLQEHLNLGQKAIDYFRASSALLKAGVKAGLTLYDIAILCCRNDNLAEVPSMMEKLFSPVSELAYVAVENEHWHHAAASRDIADQLSPPGRVLEKTSPFNGSFLRKSASSTGLRSFDKSESLLSDSGCDSPGMAQSSVSDTDTNSDQGEEDCEEWAASVVAEMKMDMFTIPRRSSRSGSIVLDDASTDSSNLSSSPKGFWTVPPSSSLPAGDDASLVSWSPILSRVLLDSVETPPGLTTTETKTPSVSLGATSCIPPAAVSIAPFKVGKESESLFRKQDGSMMTRCKSYSQVH